EDIKEFTANIASANGSVLPKSYKDIPLNFKFNPIYFNQKTINIDVKIQDVNNNIWKDSFSFEIYKGSIDINIATKSSSIKGYIIMPNTNSIKNIDIENGTISLPLLKDKKYHLVLSNPSLENETAYSIGVNKATEDLTSFSATASHEPNDKESQSNDIAIDQSIISYLHFGDLDYWTISTAEYPTVAGESINKIELIEKISIDTRTHTVGTSVAISDNYIVFNSNLYYDENANPTHTTNILAYHYNNTTRNYSKIEDNITVQDITGFSYHDDNLKIKNNIFNVWSETYTISENNILQSGTYPESSQKYSISYDTSGVIVYDNSNETTIQIQKIDVPNTRMASIDGNKFVLTVTDGYKRDSDHAEVYTINETTNEITKIGEIQQHHIEEFKLFGEQVLIKGDYILISNTGASGGSLSGDGVLELFKINNDYNIVHYIQEIRGSQLLNQNNLYEFGISFDLHNNKLIVGSRAENSVYIYNIIE
ncbi:MAG: hypothetical protein U9N59_10560, partial [Campylobacterota bacterium]|nr:hypothetical protein [Campylobacterota bacterium]